MTVGKKPSRLHRMFAGTPLVKTLKGIAALCGLSAVVFLIAAAACLRAGAGYRNFLECAGIGLVSGVLTVGFAETIRWLQKVNQKLQKVYEEIALHGTISRQ